MEPFAPNPAVVSTEARYRMLVDAVSDYAIYMLDQQGVVVSWNMGAQRLKGYAEAIGLHFSRFYEPQDAADGVPMRALATALEHGRHGHLDAGQVRRLAARLEGHVQGIFAECKLAPQADAALHGILLPLLEGAHALAADPDDLRPVAKMQRALDAYARGFDDPGFQPH